MMMTPDRLPMVTPANHMPGPRQGGWTYQDYAALPDDGRRYEIVNGVLFMTPAPNMSHQDAVGQIFFYLQKHVRMAQLGKVYVAPFDVALSPKLVVQPDVAVILNANLEKVTTTRIIGAPDLVVEVASPSTAIYDRHNKLEAYASAGVPEYWIVDPASCTVEVLSLEDRKYYSLGIFQSKAILPSKVVPELDVHVEQFFV